MYLPRQCEPVQRTMVGKAYTSAYGATSEQGGLQPSGWFDDISNVVNTIGKVAGTVGQIGGSLGPLLGLIP
jgi:hypothetical protein